MREENFLGLRRFIGRRIGFWEIFADFFGIFSEFSTIFLENFYNFLENFPKIFAIFFNFCDFPTIFPENFSENSHPQSVTVQPGFRHYCKFTIKFTPKFTLILIKILQSTKFEGSHFFNSLATFTTFYSFLSTFSTTNRLPKPSKTTEGFSLRRRVFSTIAPPCQRYQRPSLPLRRRRYVGNTRDYK